jgi:hypothetical protein
MANVPAGLSRYKITAAEAELIGSQFILVEADVHLQLKGVAVDSTRYARHREGLYFFVLRIDDQCFKIYLGRTNALSRRMREYTSGFQPHSPNDFKLQAFQWYLAKSLPDAKLDLLFRPMPSEDLKAAEAAGISHYRPLLNETSKASNEARLALQEAFSVYVHSTFEQRLS